MPVKIPSYSDCFKVVLCDSPSENCYFFKCDECPGVKKLREWFRILFQEHNVTEITTRQWVNCPKTTLVTDKKNTSDFINNFIDLLCKLIPHDYIAAQQSAYLKKLKQSLTEKEAIVTIDFAENYAFVVQNAAPGFHWNNNQATLFNVVIYYKKGEELLHHSLVIVSDNLHHDTEAVYTYNKHVISFIKEKLPTVEKVYVVSDGAPQHFKNYKSVLNILNFKQDFGMEVEWIFFPTAHGKGPCDGIGATVKRGASLASLQSPLNPILTPQQLYDWCVTSGRIQSINFVWSPTSEYEKSVEYLKTRFLIQTRVKNLKAQHAIIPINDLHVRTKVFANSQNFQDTKFKQLSD